MTEQVNQYVKVLQNIGVWTLVLHTINIYVYVTQREDLDLKSHSDSDQEDLRSRGIEPAIPALY